MKRLFAALLLLSGAAHAQNTVVVGPLMAPNLLSEIAKQGPAAQAQAQLNLGLNGSGGGSATGTFTSLTVTDTNKNSLNLVPWLKSGTPPSPAQTDLNLDLTLNGGASGTVFANTRQYSIIRGAPNSYIWSELGVVDYVGTGGTGQHVGGYFQDIRRSSPAAGGSSNNPQLWAMVGESIDMTGTASSASNAQLSAEFDLRGANVDNANQRQGIVQVLSTWNSGIPMEASRAFGVTTDLYGQWKRDIHLTGNYSVAAIDLRDSKDNGYASGSRPTVASSTTSNTVSVTNVMPFTSDLFGRDVNQGYPANITINGTTYSETGYAITGNGPAGTLTLATNVSSTDGTAGNAVLNGSHTVWLGNGQDIALDTLGQNFIKYESGVNSISLWQGTTRVLRGNSAIITAGVPLQLKSYTIGTLPAASYVGEAVWVTDCRNGSEGAGAGTGCIYTVNGSSSWTANPSIPSAAITIGGQAISLGGSTANQGNGSKIQLSTGTAVNGHCVQFDANGNTVDAGSACGSGSGGSGSVSSGTANSLAYYAASGTAVAATNTLANGVLVTSGTGVPSISATLPAGLSLSTPTITSASLVGTTSVAGLTSSAKINAPASTTSAAPLNIGQGSAPTSPVNGDVWINGGIGLQYRANGSTVTPPAGVTGTSPITVTGTGNLSIACPTCVVGNQPGAAIVQWPSNVTVSNDTYYVTMAWPWATGTINSVRYATGGSSTPSFSISVQINGTNVTSCSGLTVNSATATTTTCTAANAVTTGQKVTLVVTSVSGSPSAAQVQVNYSRSGT